MKHEPHGTFKNRIVGYGEERVDQIVFNPMNWRLHPREQQDALIGLMSEVGIIQGVIVNRVTGNLVDGHMRVLVADRAEEETIPATYVELSPKEEEIVLASRSQGEMDAVREVLGVDDLKTRIPKKPRKDDSKRLVPADLLIRRFSGGAVTGCGGENGQTNNI